MKKFIFLLLGTIMFLITSNQQTIAKDTLKVKIDNIGTIEAPYPNLNKSADIKKDVDKSDIYNDLRSVAIHYGIKADTLVTKTLKFIDNSANNLWIILVRQQKVNSFYYLTLIILEFLLIYKLVLFYNTKSKEGELNDFHRFYLIIGWIFVISLSIYNSLHVLKMYTGFINPKYAALKELYELSQTVILK